MGAELRNDALSRSGTDRFELRVGLPWIRSLPLWCVLDLEVELDGRPVDCREVRVRLGADQLPLSALTECVTWWFLQDRLVLSGPLPEADAHEYDVDVRMRLLLPYLHAPGDSAPALPFRFGRRLRVGATAAPGVGRDVS